MIPNYLMDGTTSFIQEIEPADIDNFNELSHALKKAETEPLKAKSMLELFRAELILKYSFS